MASFQNKKKYPRVSTGFTVLEALLYTGIASVLIGAIAGMLAAVQTTQVKVSTINRVDTEGSRILATIVRTLRNGASITTPVAAATSTTLAVATYAGADNPTIFAKSGTVLTIKKGAATAVNLTSTNVQVQDFVVENLTHAGTPGTVRVYLKLTHRNTTLRKEYAYTAEFVTGASLRPPS